MNRCEFLDERRMIAAGNEQAAQFLLVWDELVEAMDDTVDEPVTAEFKIRTAQLFNLVYSHPFYVQHVRELSLLVGLINNAYADSEECAKSHLGWKKELGDVLRHSAGEMSRAVALLCGGYDHLRTLSMKFHEGCYYRHHRSDGTPE